MNKCLLSWSDFQIAVAQIADYVRSRTVENLSAFVVYGEPRGGLPLAVALSHTLGIPFVTSPHQNMIWVDDIYETGATYRRAQAQFAGLHVISVVWVTKTNTQPEDVFSVVQVSTDQWVVFPFEVQTESSADQNGYYNPVYPVNDLYPCIQGEGAQTGVPMLLLRLHGCPVACPWCDTKETWKIDPSQRVDNLDDALGANEHYAECTASEIASAVRKRAGKGIKWVLLTGGEPALHDLRPLVDSLHEAGYQVAIETSGTELGHVGAGIDWVCVSPKMSMPGGRVVLPAAIAAADEIKQVVVTEKDIYRLEGLLSTCQTKPNLTTCLQPVSQSTKATDICIQTCQERGWRLSLQTHKFIQQR